MREREITEDYLQAILADPERVERGRDEIRKYYATVEGRRLIVILAHDTEPPFVVTVMIAADE